MGILEKVFFTCDWPGGGGPVFEKNRKDP